MLSLDVTPGEVLAAANMDSERGMLAAALATGRVRATVVSAKTGAHVAIHLTCKAKLPNTTGHGEGWRVVPYAECTRVYVNQPLGGDNGKADIGTLYPTGPLGGKWAGKFFHPSNVDPGRVWAARFVIEAAAGRPVADDQAELLLGVHCVTCGAELDEQDSIRRMMGPVCARKAGMLVDASKPHVRGDTFADTGDLRCETHGWTGTGYVEGVDLHPPGPCRACLLGDEAIRQDLPDVAAAHDRQRGPDAPMVGTFDGDDDPRNLEATPVATAPPEGLFEITPNTNVSALLADLKS